ncbi:MAG: DUF3034 family protein [Candidatus Nanopelagicaceae bacterium]|nr:DUF3034 family protein [Candidatus Nanopelagicaceae bacterium]
MRNGLNRLLLIALLGASPPVFAGGRLPATGGVSQLEGSAGGGIVPWALIAGYGTRDEIGATAFYTHLDISDFRLQSAGVAIGFHDRLEVSFARQRFGLGSTVPGQSIEQDIVGLKLKMSGDAVFDQDTWQPQLALGVQYKHNRDFNGVPRLLGARDDSGVDVYVSATKLYLAAVLGRNVLLNATLRGTRANQMGLLGFGGDKSDQYSAQFEGSAAIFLNDHLAIGMEYRSKPNNLSVFREDDYRDIFAAWIPGKRVAFTLAYAQLGTIANQTDQTAVYASVQVSH